MLANCAFPSRQTILTLILTLVVVSHSAQSQEGPISAVVSRGLTFRIEDKLDSALACFEGAEKRYFAADSIAQALNAMCNVADVYTRMSFYAWADSIARRAVELAILRLGDTSRVCAKAYSTLAYLATLQDRFAEALAYDQKSTRYPLTHLWREQS